MSHHFPSIDYVMSLTPTGMREGRDSVMRIMEILWNPQNKLKVFHVTGSNGKWSVCQMISQVLWKSFWKKIGLFTSPHFITINERFQINGIPITDVELEKYYKRVMQLAEEHKILLSFFEIQVIVMVLYFVAEEVEYAVVEVGLGGIYDGTNIFEKPLACFITSITLEHTHVLGKTRTSILKNKLGIIKNGTALYTPLRNKLIEKACQENHTSLYTLLPGQKKKTNLPWPHQERNAGLVFEALKNLGFDAKKLETSLQNMYNPGRFEWIAPHILVDTANNRENIGLLKNMIQKINHKKIITIYGTTQVDRAYASELAQMIPTEKRILVDDFCDRALPCETYSSWVVHDDTIHLFEEQEKIKELLKKTDYTLIIYGSFYLVWEIMRLSIYKPFATE